jgi:hypothetical protein
LEIAAREMKLQIRVLNANNVREINEAFETIAPNGPTLSSSGRARS